MSKHAADTVLKQLNQLENAHALIGRMPSGNAIHFLVQELAGKLGAQVSLDEANIVDVRRVAQKLAPFVSADGEDKGISTGAKIGRFHVVSSGEHYMVEQRPTPKGPEIRFTEKVGSTRLLIEKELNDRLRKLPHYPKGKKGEDWIAGGVEDYFEDEPALNEPKLKKLKVTIFTLYNDSGNRHDERPESLTRADPNWSHTVYLQRNGASPLDYEVGILYLKAARRSFPKNRSDIGTEKDKGDPLHGGQLRVDEGCVLGSDDIGVRSLYGPADRIACGPYLLVAGVHVSPISKTKRTQG